MKDLHCHLLPGLDDGAASPEETEEMLLRASQCGVDTIAATSHYSRETDPLYEEKWKATEPVARKYGIRLLRGCEYDLVLLPGVPEGAFRPLGDTDCVLVDMNSDFMPPSMTELFFRLELAGYKTVFAHPERMLSGESLEKLLDFLIAKRLYIQVDIGSITGRYGHRAAKNAFRILDAGICHLLAGDAHKARHFLVDECRDIVDRRYGTGAFDLLTETNPSALLEGGNLRPLAKRKTFFQRLFSPSARRSS